MIGLSMLKKTQFTSKEFLTSQWQSLLDQTQCPSCLLALDIGGTKISYAGVKVDCDGIVQDDLFFFEKIPTQKGLDSLLDAIVTIVDDSLKKSKAKGLRLLPIITAGSPGRFIGSNNDIIANGSAANMERFSGEWDGVCLVNKIKSVLPDFCSVIIKNDAIAQFSAGLSHVLKDPHFRPQMLNQKVAYIGPGTGLGGGFGYVNQSGHPTYYTDGHIYDIRMTTLSGDTVKAEDLFSGRAFHELTGHSAKDVNTNPMLLEKFKSKIQLMGIYMAKIIEVIYDGSIQKVNPQDNWPVEDIDLVKGTHIYLIGGSLGTQGIMGQWIIDTAMSELRQTGIQESIILIPIHQAQHAAILGAAQFASQD